ncbi:helix-turn-helix domain-containing protein [Streptomyces bullii]|uniref:Helix-turn-helix domain-containing protein n=1 Tax=Streptomyces bullii TaxID=349910 RepID=A0ABW0UT44_9ACTN
MERRPKTNPEALITRRFAAGLSQTALARKIGCSKQLVSGAERGLHGLSLERLARIAGVLGCEVRDLLLPEQDDQATTKPAGSSV